MASAPDRRAGAEGGPDRRRRPPRRRADPGRARGAAALTEEPMLTRRDFLARSALLATAGAVPAFLCRTARAAAPGRDGRVLVVVQLDGGNDGINTVVPFKDEGYAKHRPTLRLPATGLLKVDAEV